MSQFPYHEQFKPEFTIRSITPEDIKDSGTPFGLSCWQVFDRAKCTLLLRTIAKKIGMDASASVVVEPVLRWHTSEKERREPVVLSHSDLIYQIDASNLDSNERSLIGDGLILVAACQIVLSREAYLTFRELFTNQPVSAATGTIVAKEPNRLPTQKTNLADADLGLRNQLVRKFGKAGTTIFDACGSSYPVTLSVLANTNNLSMQSAPAMEEDEFNDVPLDDMPSADSPASNSNIREAPAAPIPSLNDTNSLLAFQRQVLLAKHKKFRVNLIVRGYVTRELVRLSPRLSQNNDHFYVLDGALIASNPENASNTRARPIAHIVQNDDDDMKTDQQQPAEIPTIWEWHLLDRLESIEMQKLTYYEVDLSIRDRFNLHFAVFALIRANIDDRQIRSRIRRYPRGYKAPVLQKFFTAPGLLSSATEYDYAAIGLAGLCIVASQDAEFRQWLLDAEALYYRILYTDADPTRHLIRIEKQINNVRFPTSGDLARLLGDVLSDAKTKIAFLKKEEVTADEVDDDDEGSSEEDDIPEEIDDFSGDGDIIE